MTDINRDNKIAVKILAAAAVSVFWVLHLFFVFHQTNLLGLFLSPIIREEFGGEITYAVIYSVFYISVFIMLFLNHKKYLIPSAVMILFETVSIFLPIFYFGQKFGTKHAGYYMQSIFSARLSFTLKSLAIIVIFAIILILTLIKSEKLKIVLKICVPIISLCVLFCEFFYLSSPEMKAEILSFDTKITTSLVCDAARFIPLSIVAFTA